MVYVIPNTLDEALRHLEAGGATILAGGTDVYPSLAGRNLPEPMVDISAIGGLRGIHRQGDRIRIGGATRWSDIRTGDLPPAFDGLKAAATQVGGVQIQNAGTIAGNICNASPAADGIPPLLTLDASVELTSARGSREVPLLDFMLGPRSTQRAADEILTAVLIPEPPPDSRGSFVKLGARRYLVISIAMVSALVRCDRTGRIAEARIAVGACAPVARRLSALEADLVGQDPAGPAVDARHLAPLAPIDDPRGTAAYRMDAVAELCRRAIRAAGGGDG
jgi:CO/xanthine dehydrogenase FAD-binding subunit